MFKDIPGTGGYYSCDENGNIKSNERVIYNKGSGCYYTIKERILKAYDNSAGYLCVDLRINNRTVKKLVSRLVALTWIPNPNNYPLINHKDNNPMNNHISNLEWCTYSYNIRYCIKQGRQNLNTDAYIKARKMPKKYLWVPVEKYDINGTFIDSFPSITAAAETVQTINRNSAKSNIQACCVGRAHTSYGYVWKYANNKNVTTNSEENNSQEHTGETPDA